LFSRQRNQEISMRTILAVAATAMIGLAAPAFAQQTLQPGSPGVGPGGAQPYTGGPANAGPDQVRPDGMNEGRAAAPDYDASPNRQKIDPMAPNNPASRNNGQ
jgi:hypothetical protein